MLQLIHYNRPPIIWISKANRIAFSDILLMYCKSDWSFLKDGDIDDMRSSHLKKLQHERRHEWTNNELSCKLRLEQMHSFSLTLNDTIKTSVYHNLVMDLQLDMMELWPVCDTIVHVLCGLQLVVRYNTRTLLRKLCTLEYL